MADLGSTVRGYLAAVTAVETAVGTRIYPDVLPQGYSVRGNGGALIYSVISTIHDHMINGLAGIARSRIEFTAFASTRAGANLIAEAVRASGIIGYTGAMDGVLIESVRLEDGIQTMEERPTDGSQEHRYLTIFDLLFAYQESI